jgi:hypothetical protein
MRTNHYATCPYCHKNYQLIIPKGGDGSAEYFPRHQRDIIAADNFRDRYHNKMTCQGSYKEAPIEKVKDER